MKCSTTILRLLLKALISITLLSIPSLVAADDFTEFSELQDEFGVVTPVSDPLSGYNRVVFQFNDRLYRRVLNPVARDFGKVVPKPARRGLSRAFRNIATPVRFCNNLLQLKFRRAGAELGRFAINTTVGIAGLFDPASKLGLQAPPAEDFGQTLGKYGVPAGPHLQIPILGPSNVRDALAIIPDALMQPYVPPVSSTDGFIVEVSDTVTYTSLHLDEYEILIADALDAYRFVQDAYEQNRNNKIEE